MNDPFKLPTPFGNTSTSNNKQNNQGNQSKNLLEMFREQGTSATTGMIGNAADQLFGTPQAPKSPNIMPHPQMPGMPPNPNGQPPFNFAEFLKRREQRIRQQERGMADQQRRQEKVIFHQKEQSAKKEIEAIKQEILKIIKTTNGISAEILSAEQSAMGNTVEAGTYHINFFQRIRRLLAIAKKNLAESAHWLEQFNNRKKAKGVYWQNVKKSGAKYQLSSERSVVTQTG